MTRGRAPRPHEIQAAARDPRFLRAQQANPDDPNWRTGAACRGLDPEAWFPLPTEPADMALAVCGNCDVQPECLAAALNIEATASSCGIEGIWGATTARQRRAMLVAWRGWRRSPTGAAP